MHAPGKIKALLVPAVVALVALSTTGCPTTGTQSDYDVGFMDGFNDNDYYWNGYFDSWDTLDDSPVYYTGDTIPYVETPPYDAGYNDGLWYAYHDGYFVSYKYSFIVGFSEGYDNAYWSDYLDFLAEDQHVEYRNGGFGDGYMDGFSEGRVFGAYDFESGIEFDWLGALLDYEGGLDLYFEEVDVGTGEFGPVILYEHGQDPNDLTKAPRKAPEGRKSTPAIRFAEANKAIDIDQLELYRTIINDAKTELSIAPQFSLRSDRELLLTNTWLDRVNQYLAEATKAHTTNATRAAGPRAKAPTAQH